jgi:3-phenylpropionate/trans-cinnamate dioxygenase ferredoxin subunit
MNQERKWIRIADSVEAIPFNANHLAEVDAGGKLLCVGRHAGQLFAFARNCPHSSAALSEGYVDAVGNVVCHLHHYKFCMKNGRNVSGEGYYLRHWPVEVRSDGVFVGIESHWLDLQQPEPTG